MNDMTQCGKNGIVFDPTTNRVLWKHLTYEERNVLSEWKYDILRLDMIDGKLSVALELLAEAEGGAE